MRFLVFLEHHGGALEKGGLGVLAKAASLGDAEGVVLGEGAAGVAAAAGALRRRMDKDVQIHFPADRYDND